MKPKTDPSKPPKTKTRITLEELTELVFPTPGASPEIIGNKLNKSQLAAEHGVSLVTVDNWLRRGCPVAGREGRELVFDSFRVFLWREMRKACDDTLLAMDRQQITEEIECANASLLHWFHSDSARREDPQLCAALHSMNAVLHFLHGRE
jgi:hypothetical protein